MGFLIPVGPGAALMNAKAITGHLQGHGGTKVRLLSLQ